MKVPLLDEPEEKETSAEGEAVPEKIDRKLFFMGNLFCIAGIAGIVGLRIGIIQNMLGDPAPYPGIGYAEPTGHIVSMIPLIIGVLMVFLWGLRNDPIYYEMERAKEEEIDEVEEEDELQFDVSEEPLEPAEETATEELPSPEPEKKVAGKPVSKELMKSLDDLVDDIKAVSERPREISKEAEEKRVARCEKMLAVAKIMPEDKEKLRLLISTGISAGKFTEEMKKAIDRKKKKDEERALTAAEKAAILEEELVRELEDLEEEFKPDNDELDDGDLEDQILKEIEDLEDV